MWIIALVILFLEIVMAIISAGLIVWIVITMIVEMEGAR